MAQKKTKNQTNKKVASRFYVVRSIQDARKNMTERVENYHREFIQDPIRSGKEIVEDFRDDPRKAIDALVEDMPVQVEFLAGLIDHFHRAAGLEISRRQR